MTDTDERAAFEAWWNTLDVASTDAKIMARVAWQARAALSAPAQPVAWNVRADEPNTLGWYYGTEAEALRAKANARKPVIITPLYAHPQQGEKP